MKTKKKYNAIKQSIWVLLFLGSTLIQTGCEDSIEGDVNIDPLVGNDIDVNLLMPQVLLAGFSSTRTIELNQMNSQAQHWSATAGFGVFVNPERYNIGPNTVNNTWSGLFTSSLRNLQQIRLLTEANNPSARNIIGQARILEAFSFFNATLIFEDIPFSEATNVSEFPIPQFDTQEQVLRGLPALIDLGLAELQTETDIISSADLLFGGDRESWIRFGNTLKLKILMLIANVDPASVQGEIQAVANQPLILEASQNAVLQFINSPGNENPIWGTLNAFAGGNNLFWGGATTLIDIMNANQDPRRFIWFDQEEGAFVGQDQGVFSATGISQVSANIIRQDQPDIYANASETNFLLAEAALRGFITGGSAAANAFYRAGIQESFNFYGNGVGAIPEVSIPDADAQAYLASPQGSIDSDSEADALRKIHLEHWISDFTRPVEAWTTWRRNKVPDLQQPIQAVLPDIIRRYPYSVLEITANPNVPNTAPLETPMWFENE